MNAQKEHYCGSQNLTGILIGKKSGISALAREQSSPSTDVRKCMAGLRANERPMDWIIREM